MHVVPTVEELSALWRLLILRSGIVLALSIAALPWPVQSLVAIVILVSVIALVAALFDAAISGVLQLRTVGGWALFPEAIVGVLLGGAVLLYPLVPLGAIAVLLSCWVFARGVMLLTVVRRTASDAMLRTLATGWAAVSLLVPVAILVEWREATILYVIAVLLTYVLIWSGLELAIGLHLRSRARQPRRA